MKEIIYPKKWNKKQSRFGTRYVRDISEANKSITVSTGSYDYVLGYRQAIKDIKKLNK